MKYNKFGNTGDKVSQIGFGGMRLPGAEINGQFQVDQDRTDELVTACLDAGINYYDTACYYCDNQAEQALGRALGVRRKDILLATKSPLYQKVKQPGDFRRALEESLQELGTDYIDYYQFWSAAESVYHDYVVGMNIMDEIQKLKDEGLIRHIGFSFHSAPEDLDFLLDHIDGIDQILLQYNVFDRRNGHLIDKIKQKGIGLVAMGAFSDCEIDTPIDFKGMIAGKTTYTPYEFALKDLLRMNKFDCILSSMTSSSRPQNKQLVQDSVAFAEQAVPLTEAEIALLDSI